MKNFLHIGVMRGGRLIDERYVPEKGEITVGSSAKNVFALIGSSLPANHTLFSFKAKHPIIHIAGEIRGEIALDGKTPASLAELQAKGRKGGDGWELDLPDTARGWVGMGDAAFFFNVAPKPPPPPKNSLPVQIKTSFLSGVEKTFTAALVAIVLAEAGGVAFVHSQPEIDVDKPAEEDLDRFAEIIMPDKPKEDPEQKKREEEERKKAAEEAAKKAAEEAAKKKDEKPPEEKPAPKDDSPPPDAAAEAARKDKLKQEVAKKGLLNVLGSAGGAGGALANVFAQSAGFGDDVEKALSGGVKVATGGEDAGARKGIAGGTGVVGVGDLAATAGGGGGGTVALKEKPKVAAPQIAFDDSEFETESSSVDKDSLGKYIKARIKSVQGCYEKELKLNPTLKGKIVVRFVITTQGRVGEVTIDQNTMGNDNVAACIQRLVKTWTFPIKPEEDSPVTFPFVFSPGG